MKKKLLIALTVLVILLVLIGLYFYIEPKNAVKIVFPEVEEVRKVKLKVEEDTVRIQLDALIRNESIFKLHIDSLYYRVSLDTTMLLKADQAINLVLPKGNEDTVLFTVGLPFKRLQRQIESLQKQDSTFILFKAEIVYDTWMGEARLPVERKVEIEVPKPPRISVTGTEYVGRDKKNLLVNVHLKVDNPGKLDLKISKLRYKMDVEDLFTAEQVYPEMITIKPGSSDEVILPVKVDLERPLKAALLVLTDNDKVNYKLRMKAVVESDFIQADDTPFELEKDGIIELKK